MSVPILKDAVAGPVTSWTRVAVRADGRRHADHIVLTADTVIAPGAVVVLDHAGPAASRWSVDRPIGAEVILDPVSDRRSTALDDVGWVQLLHSFACAAQWVRAAGGTPVVAIDDDGLLHSALSPLSCTPTHAHRVLTVLCACAPCDLLLVIEDLAPRGLDVTAGLSFARDAVLGANAKRLYATGGTAWLPPLRDRKKGRSVDIEGHDLATAAWAVGRVDVDVEVHGVVRSDAPIDVLTRKAMQYGLAGFIIDERAVPTTTATPLAPDPFESR